MSLIAPTAAQVRKPVNLEEINSYVLKQTKSSRLDSKTFINEVSEDIANLKGRIDGLETRQNNFEAGSFSDTTSLSGKAVFVIGAIDHPVLEGGQLDGHQHVAAHRSAAARLPHRCGGPSADGHVGVVLG